MAPTVEHEMSYWQAGHIYVAGVDEVGRGCLAGPVFAGAVVLPPDRVICNVLRTEGLRDSKKLSAAKREALVPLIEEVALSIGIGKASAHDIDQYGIVLALRLAMARALRDLACLPTALLIDGRPTGTLFSPTAQIVSDAELIRPSALKFKGHLGHISPSSPLEPQCFIIRGDNSSLSIAAAAVIAKVYRDRLMEKLDSQFPGYGFASNKGYAAKRHRLALQTLGPTPIHRMSWKPLQALKAKQLTLM